LILSGGFNGWASKYWNNDKLIENKDGKSPDEEDEDE